MLIKVSTLSQAVHGGIAALEERTARMHIQTQQLQTHADRELYHRSTS